MLQSKLFYKTSKEVSKEEKSINAQLLIRAGFINKLMAGVYTFLPLGLKVYKKIENIIREEMNAIGGQEILMPALHPKELWQTTGRWEIKEMFKTISQTGSEYGLGWTHEEIVTPLAKNFFESYKNLPFALYQIQTKFRDELRAKSGLLRCREFAMKDLYSFHADEKDLDRYYEKVKKAYFKIFKRVGLGKITYLTFASGGAFSKYSHEFQTVTPSGEDIIYLCPKCKIAINKEIIDESNWQCIKCGNKNLEEKKAIEVGNIFKLKDKFTKAFGYNFRDKTGKEKIVLMGCYGIGLGRLMGAVVEIYHDERGIIWPKEIAPYDLHLVAIFSKNSSLNKRIQKVALDTYVSLQKEGFDVLYDDRKEVSAGVKLVESDLIGIPIRLLISEKTLASDSVEIKKRESKNVQLIKISQVLNRI
jgi:prolyl-tRNA synthetase